MRNKRKKSGISLILAAALSFVCPAGLAAGQQQGGDKTGASSTRTIEGRVLTRTGDGVPGAVVLLKDNKTLQIRSYIAQQDGAYHFFGLSTEINYTLRAANAGRTSKQKMVSVFDSHREVKLDLKLSQEIKQPKSQHSKEK
jgi:hypothetical protein